MTDNLSKECADYLAQITAVIARTPPGALMPNADAKEIRTALRNIGKLVTRLTAMAEAATPKPAGPSPGAQLHAMALAAIEASGGKLSYSGAWATLVMDHWPLIQEWQRDVKAALLGHLRRSVFGGGGKRVKIGLLTTPGIPYNITQ